MGDHITYLQRKEDARLEGNAKRLRHQMTKEECHLWFDFLKGYPIRIMRQKIIAGYIVDFYCAKAFLAIELDGSQHYEPKEQMRDLERSRKIEAYGVKVIRFTNLDVWRDFEAVKESIHDEIQSRIVQK